MKLRMLGTTALVASLAVGSPLAVAAQDGTDPMAADRFMATVGDWDVTGIQAPFEATDVRASGLITEDLEELTIHGGTPDFFVLEALAVRIENDGGTWSGSGLRTFGNGVPGVATVTLLGDGDYHGLTMILYPGDDDGDPYSGIIVPTADLPEPPALGPAE